MKFHFGVAVVIFLATTLAVPVRKKRNFFEDPFVRVIQNAKSEKFHANLETIIKEPSTFLSFLKNTNQHNLLKIMMVAKSSGKLEAILKAANVIVQLLKATMVEGANPTDSALAEMAKKMAKVLRESNLRVHAIMPEIDGTLIANDTIALLKDIITNHPIVSEGNNFVKIFEEKHQKLGMIARRARWRNVLLKKMLSMTSVPSHSPCGDDDTDCAEGQLKQFEMFSLLDQMLVLLQSEENAIEIFKEFGSLISAMKNPQSYDSLEAVHKAFSKSKIFEAYSNLVQHGVSCYLHPLSPIYKVEQIKIFEAYLPVIRLAWADRQNLENEAFRAAVEKHFEENYTTQKVINRKLRKEYSKGASLANLRQCLLSDGDIALFKEIMLSDTALVPAEKLNEFKNKSKLVYGITQFLNIHVKFAQRQVGLSDRAKAFRKEFVTVPNLLLDLSQYVSPPHDMLEKSAEVKKKQIQMFNGLPLDVKMELVDFDPYNFAEELALLD